MELSGIGESLLGRPPAPKGTAPLHAEDTKYILIGLRWLLVEWLSSLFKFCSWFWRIIALRLNACHHLRPSSLTYGPCSLLPQWLCTCSSCEALTRVLQTLFFSLLSYVSSSISLMMPSLGSFLQSFHSASHNYIDSFSGSVGLTVCTAEVKRVGFFFFFGGTTRHVDISSLTRDWTHPSCGRSSVLTSSSNSMIRSHFMKVPRWAFLMFLNTRFLKHCLASG